MKLIPRLREFETEVGDRILGISTLGLAPAAHPEIDAEYHDSYWYQSKNFYLNWLFLRPLRLKKSDIVFDIGCGAGRLLCVAALFKCRRCVGIELSPSLCELARQNAGRLRFRRAEIEIREGDAASADYAAGTVFAFCNPFGADTMLAVLKRIHASVLEHPRDISMIYIHPHASHRAVLADAGWLSLVSEKYFPGQGAVPVCYYEHVQRGETFAPPDHCKERDERSGGTRRNGNFSRADEVEAA